MSHVHSRTPLFKRYYVAVEGEDMKKKIITMVLLGFLMVGTLTSMLSKPSIQKEDIVLEYGEDDPRTKIGG